MKIVLNEDKELVEDIRKRITLNGGYCPCSIIRDETTKCMCEEFRESDKLGYCHCTLYKKVEE